MQKTHSPIEHLSLKNIGEERKTAAQPLIDYIQKKVDENNAVHLHFICTHNSRRSQFAQIWAQVFGLHYGINLHTYSGGVEVTNCNARVIETLKAQGFNVGKNAAEENPRYLISDHNTIFGTFYSKMYDHPNNPKSAFAAVMTCAHADTHCPLVPGSEVRIPLRYTDPKVFDNTPNEQQGYLDKSIEIAAEMNYIFQQIKTMP